MAEEMGLQYEVVPGTLGSAELLAVNPCDTLPAFQDGDVVLSESMAIVQYLGGRYGPTPLVPSPSDSNYAAYLQFSWAGEASLATPLTAKILNQLFAPDHLKGGWITDYTRSAITKRITLVSRALERSPYVAGDAFTAADISVFYALNLFEYVELPDLLTPKIVEYRERMRARPAFQRALAR
jgi:glutathione S-transferase